MLILRDAGGNNLQAIAPAPVAYFTDGKTYRVGIYCELREDDPDLLFKTLSLDIDWNDGSKPDQLAPANGVLIANTSKVLPLGTYAIKVTGHNNRSPVPDSVQAVFIVAVRPLSTAVSPAVRLIGPILPRDDGNPGPQTWLFDTGTDLGVLVSAVKMLLITNKGDRIMEPNYGTSLRRILFELNAQAVESIVQREISTALALYEPRVQINQLSVQRNPNRREVVLSAVFSSDLVNQPFEINLQYVR